MNIRKELQKLYKEKERVRKNLPLITEVIRGTFIPWYGKCKNRKCKCHMNKRYRHGPYYRISYSKGSRSHHVYVSLSDKEKIKTWVNNYQKIWDAIERISGINIKIIKLKRSHRVKI